MFCRCPASNSCSGLRPNETVTTRTPLHEYPSLSNFDNENPKDVLMNRAEPNTPDRCCDDLPSGQYCKENCVKRIQNDETALSVDVGYYLDFQVKKRVRLGLIYILPILRLTQLLEDQMVVTVFLMLTGT